ncbi:hypothetical protein GMMP15_30003 [Candidatus Magnetomoraceae bacterium gMMP-15]
MIKKGLKKLKSNIVKKLDEWAEAPQLPNQDPELQEFNEALKERYPFPDNQKNWHGCDIVNVSANMLAGIIAETIPEHISDPEFELMLQNLDEIVKWAEEKYELQFIPSA